MIPQVDHFLRWAMRAFLRMLCFFLSFFYFCFYFGGGRGRNKVKDIVFEEEFISLPIVTIKNEQTLPTVAIENDQSPNIQDDM